MKHFGERLSEMYKAIGAIIKRPDMLAEAKEQFLDLHARLHLSSMACTPKNAVDTLLDDLLPQEDAVMPTVKDETIAWALWHIARIEDLTMKFLAAEDRQLLDDERQRKIGASVTDTGNAMSDGEIMELSRQVDTGSLLA